MLLNPRFFSLEIMTEFHELENRVDLLQGLVFGPVEDSVEVLNAENDSGSGNFAQPDVNEMICKITNCLAKIDSSCPGFSFVAEQAQNLSFPSSSSSNIDISNNSSSEFCESLIDTRLKREIIMHSAGEIKHLEQQLNQIDNLKYVVAQPKLDSTKVDELEEKLAFQSSEVRSFHAQVVQLVEVYSTTMEAISRQLIEWDKKIG
uniref:Uncharacterized protein n=1 Tax=Aplanochytrium stocchinoi TaxID=215587 RepID=A0A7S3V256_9STRA